MRAGARAANASSSLLPDRLRVDGESDLVSNDDAAAVERAVPAHPEVVAVDGRRGHESGAQLRSLVHVSLPPGRRPGAERADLEDDRPDDSADGEVAVDLELGGADAPGHLAAEADLWVAFHVEEVRAAQ